MPEADFSRFGPRIAALLEVAEARIAAARERKPNPYTFTGTGAFDWDRMRAEVMVAALKSVLIGGDFAPWVPQLLGFGVNPRDVLDVAKVGLEHARATKRGAA